MNGQVSRGSAGEYQADERVGVARLSWRVPEVSGYGTLHARTVTLFYFLLAFAHACAAILQGAGKSAVSMGVMASIWCVFRVTFITIVAKLTHNLRFILSVYPITWGISSIIFILYLKKADWMHSYEKMKA